MYSRMRRYMGVCLEERGHDVRDFLATEDASTSFGILAARAALEGMFHKLFLAAQLWPISRFDSKFCKNVYTT